MAAIELYFTDEADPSLAKTVFEHSELDEPLKTMRGGSAALDGYSSFRWTPAVQALAILMIGTAAKGSEFELSGEAGSPAASLDYAITKQTAWLLDMFGLDYEGTPLIRGFVRRYNSERKRPGPVKLLVDPQILPPSSIRIFLDDSRVEDPAVLWRLAERLEHGWRKGGAGSSRARELGGSADFPDSVFTPSEEAREPAPAVLPHAAAAAETLPPIPEALLVRPHVGSLEISMPRLVAGFSLTVGSAAFWGLGNVVTRWTAGRLPQASFDIALLKYLVAAAVLLVFGLLLSQRAGIRLSIRDAAGKVRLPQFFFAAVAKGINTYSWILAVTLIAAGTVATLENLHIVWTALLVTLIFKEAIPGAWIAGSMTVLIGATLITGLMIQDFTPASLAGLMLGLVSGVAFSCFLVFWNATEHPASLPERTVEMALLLFLSACLMYPLHLLVNALWLQGSLLPLAEVGLHDGVIQALNGLFGIGLTYFLLNEANAVMQKSGNLATLLLAIGMSFAVPITMVAEWLMLDRDIHLYQWMGVVLFVIGFTTVRAGILRLSR